MRRPAVSTERTPAGRAELKVVALKGGAGDECIHFLTGFDADQTMQIQLGLQHPVPAPRLALGMQVVLASLLIPLVFSLL